MCCRAEGSEAEWLSFWLANGLLTQPWHWALLIRLNEACITTGLNNETHSHTCSDLHGTLRHTLLSQWKTHMLYVWVLAFYINVEGQSECDRALKISSVYSYMHIQNRTTWRRMRVLVFSTEKVCFRHYAQWSVLIRAFVFVHVPYIQYQLLTCSSSSCIMSFMICLRGVAVCSIITLALCALTQTDSGDSSSVSMKDSHQKCTKATDQSRLS